MTKGDQPSWMVARRGLDHHEAVVALKIALPSSIIYADDEVARDQAAENLATALARAGLVLVRMDVEQARDFFSRTEDT